MAETYEGKLLTNLIIHLGIRINSYRRRSHGMVIYATWHGISYFFLYSLCL